MSRSGCAGRQRGGRRQPEILWVGSGRRLDTREFDFVRGIAVITRGLGNDAVAIAIAHLGLTVKVIEIFLELEALLVGHRNIDERSHRAVAVGPFNYEAPQIAHRMAAALTR